MRPFHFIPLLIAAALLAALLSPARLGIYAKQRGFSARLSLRFSFLFGILRFPLELLIEFDLEKALEDPIKLKNAVSVFRLGKRGERKPMKKRKQNGEGFSVSRVVGALSLKKLRLYGEVALDDAARCVYLCGALNSSLAPIIRLLMPFDARKAELSAVFVPKFTESAVKLELDGILEGNSAKLIKGLISALSEKRRKRNGSSPRASARHQSKPDKNIGKRRKTHASN